MAHQVSGEEIAGLRSWLGTRLTSNAHADTGTTG
jgi:hypothetical protein